MEESLGIDSVPSLRVSSTPSVKCLVRFLMLHIVWSKMDALVSLRSYARDSLFAYAQEERPPNKKKRKIERKEQK